MENRMSREERAKQFMPFAALKGYELALREKEKIVIPRMELSEDYEEQLDYRMRLIEKNDMVSVVYFCGGEYLKVTGLVARKDEISHVLRIVNTNIPFSDIYDIKILQKMRKK